MGHEEFDVLLQFFKTMGDGTRLRLLGILANRDCSVEELAALLDVRPPTVSHHLGKLRQLGLVEMRPEGNVHIYAFDPTTLRRLSKDLLTPETVAALVDDVGSEAWERKVLRDFLDGDQLKEIPASRKKRVVVLKWLARRFHPGTRYREAEVNEIIARHHPDFATLRRELVGNGLMRRERGAYWLD